RRERTALADSGGAARRRLWHQRHEGAVRGLWRHQLRDRFVLTRAAADLILALRARVTRWSEGLQIRDQTLRDDDALDLAGAFEDVVDLDVAKPLLEKLVFGGDRAFRAADLDGLDACVDCGLSGEGFRHARLFGVWLLLVGHPSGTPCHRPRRLEI